jgi:hypothetical protein
VLSGRAWGRVLNEHRSDRLPAAAAGHPASRFDRACGHLRLRELDVEGAGLAQRQGDELGALAAELATGEVDNLHQVMLKLDEAKLSFQLMVQVRNKLLEAYQDILRMQV